MKKIVLTFCFFVLFMVLTNIFSNPIVTYFFNEFMFDSTGWKIELPPYSLGQDSISLDAGYLTSRTDTAYFNDGLYLNSDRYTIITQFDLQSQFNIDEVCDTLTLYIGENYGDKICFGNSDLYSAPTPETGQSICLRVYSDGYWQHYFYYLDNTPTIGFENDTSNAKGYIDGYVKDSLNNPIEE